MVSFIIKDDNTTKTIWTRKYNQGAKWRQASVFVNESGNFRFVLEGVVSYLVLIEYIIFPLINLLHI